MLSKETGQAGTIEQMDWKQTINHYCIIIYEHTLLVAGVFLFQKLKNSPYNVSKQDQNDIFPKLMGPYQTEYNFNAIFKNKMLL